MLAKNTLFIVVLVVKANELQQHFAIGPGRHTSVLFEKGIEIVFVGKAHFFADLPKGKRGISKQAFDLSDATAPYSLGR